MGSSNRARGYVLIVMMELVRPIPSRVVPDRKRAGQPVVMRSDNPDDVGLLARVADGDERALRTLHEQYGRSVFGFLQRLLPDRPTAEDVFQQVMIEAWQRAHTFDASRGSIGGWLLLLARSRAIDELRRRRPEPMDPHSIADMHVADDDLAASMGEWQLAQLLDQLPAEERLVLEMRFRQDLSQSEIAERTGLALGTVKTRMNRGLGRLREILTPVELGGDA